MKKKKMKARIQELEMMNQILMIQNKRLLCQLKLREYLDLGGDDFKPRMPHTHEYRPYDNINKVTCNCR